MSTTIAVLGSSFLAAAITALITFFANRRKLSAEATKIITDAASGVVDMLRVENKKQADKIISQGDTINSQGDRIKLLEDKEEANERQLEELRRMMMAVAGTVQLHASYDTIVREKYERGDRDPLPPTPPLLPHDFPHNI